MEPLYATMEEFLAEWDDIESRVEGVFLTQKLYVLAKQCVRGMHDQFISRFLWEVVRTPRFARLSPYLMLVFIRHYHYAGNHQSRQCWTFWDAQIRRLMSLGVEPRVNVNGCVPVPGSTVAVREETEIYRAMTTLSAFTICMLAPRGGGGAEHIPIDLIRFKLKPMLTNIS